MDTNKLYNVTSSQLITLTERDDGNKKKQRMAEEALLPCV